MCSVKCLWVNLSPPPSIFHPGEHEWVQAPQSIHFFLPSANPAMMKGQKAPPSPLFLSHNTWSLGPSPGERGISNFGGVCVCTRIKKSILVTSQRIGTPCPLSHNSPPPLCPRLPLSLFFLFFVPLSFDIDTFSRTESPKRGRGPRGQKKALLLLHYFLLGIHSSLPSPEICL